MDVSLLYRFSTSTEPFASLLTETTSVLPKKLIREFVRTIRETISATAAGDTERSSVLNEPSVARGEKSDSCLLLDFL